MNAVALTGPRRGGYAGSVPELAPVAVAAEDSPDIGACVSDQIPTGFRHLILYSFAPWRFRVRVQRWSKWQNAPACSAVMFQPGTLYQIDTTKGPTPTRHVWVVLDSLGPTPLMALSSWSQGYLVFLDKDQQLADVMLTMVEVVERNVGNAFWPLQIHARALVKILSETRPQEVVGDGVRVITPTVPVPDRLVAQVVAFLSANIRTPIRLQHIAKAVHASVSTVAHRYRAYAGEGPMQTLRRIRMVQAKIMLLQGNRTADIAENLGFCDERYFSTQFKRTEGRSPRGFLTRARASSR